MLDRATLQQIPGARIGHLGPYPGSFSTFMGWPATPPAIFNVGEGGGRVQKFLTKGAAR